MTRRLRVLHCVPSLNASDGGPARSVPALAGSVARAGVDVRVWSRQPPTIDLLPFQPASFVTGDLDSVVTQDWVPDIIHDHGRCSQIMRRHGLGVTIAFHELLVLVVCWNRGACNIGAIKNYSRGDFINIVIC